MSSTTDLVLTLGYQDLTSRKLTLPDVAESIESAAIISKINAINTEITGAISSGTLANNRFYQTFVAESGAGMTRINAADIVTTTEEVIYSG